MEQLQEVQAVLFDLDGVLVDTAKYHYLAWKRLAATLGGAFSEQDNERLKGVSRMRSLEILLEVCGMASRFSDDERLRLADQKNQWYVDYISALMPEEMLPGARSFLAWVRRRGIKTALASASKNAGLILRRMEIADCFDAVVDGGMVRSTKPDPEVFLTAAQLTGAPPSRCVVFEDAQAGIEAARSGGMYCVAVGSAGALSGYDEIIPGLYAAGETRLFAACRGEVDA